MLNGVSASLCFRRVVRANSASKRPVCCQQTNRNDKLRTGSFANPSRVALQAAPSLNFGVTFSSWRICSRLAYWFFAATMHSRPKVPSRRGLPELRLAISGFQRESSARRREIVPDSRLRTREEWRQEWRHWSEPTRSAEAAPRLFCCARSPRERRRSGGVYTSPFPCVAVGHSFLQHEVRGS